jgi:hypothetical protein
MMDRLMGSMRRQPADTAVQSFVITPREGGDENDENDENGVPIRRGGGVSRFASIQQRTSGNGGGGDADADAGSWDDDGPSPARKVASATGGRPAAALSRLALATGTATGTPPAASPRADSPMPGAGADQLNRCVCAVGELAGLLLGR